MILPIWLRIRTYFSECIRLLYWTFFKPDTFRRVLEEGIGNPTLGNVALTRMLLQLGSMSIFGSLVFVLVMNIVFAGLFNWLYSAVFLVSWAVILQPTLSFGVRRIWREFLIGGLFRLLALALLFSLIFLCISYNAELVGFVTFSMASGLALGLLSGLTLDLILLLVEDAIPLARRAYILMCGWSLCQAIGLTYGLVFGLSIDLQSLINALTVSLIGGLAYGLGGTVSWILLFVLSRGWRERRWIRGLTQIIVGVMIAGALNSISSGMSYGLQQTFPASFTYTVNLFLTVSSRNLSIDKVLNLTLSSTILSLSWPGWILCLTVTLIWCLSISLVAGLLWSVLAGVAWSLLFGIGWGWTCGLASVLGVLLGAPRLLFWIVECLWMAGITSFFKTSSLRNATYWLRQLPPYWDERIFLSLPWFTRFIERVAQEDHEATQQTLEYLITSTRQKRAAIRSLLRIATPLLARCQTLDDIGAIANQLTWISNLQTQGKSIFFLAQFIEVSQQVHTARHVNLEIPLALLHTMQAQFAQSKTNKQATTFSPIVQQWLVILEKS